MNNVITEILNFKVAYLQGRDFYVKEVLYTEINLGFDKGQILLGIFLLHPEICIFKFRVVRKLYSYIDLSSTKLITLQKDVNITDS